MCIYLLYYLYSFSMIFKILGNVYHVGNIFFKKKKKTPEINNHKSILLFNDLSCNLKIFIRFDDDHAFGDYNNWIVALICGSLFL